MAATRFLTYYVPITVYNSLAICINASLGLVKSCLRQQLIVLVYSWLRGTTIKTVLWLAKASYLVFALSGLMHFSYRLLLRAQIKALIVIFACLFLYPVNFKPKTLLSVLYMAATSILTYYVLIKFFYSLAVCTYPIS